MIIWQEHDASEASSVFINRSAHLDNDKACNQPENHQENMDSPCPIQPCSTLSFCISRHSTEGSGNDCHNSEISPITGGESSSSSPHEEEQRLEAFPAVSLETTTAQMQNDTAYGGHATSAMPQSHTDDAVFASLYSAIFDRKASVSQYDVESDHSSSSAHRHRQLYNSLLVQDHQEMVNRHSRCLKRLQETSEEADALRRENVHLRSLNLELNKHLSLLVHASVQKQFGSPSSVQTTAPFGIVNGLRDMKIDDKRAEQDMSDESPMSVIESEGGDAENIDVERFSLPKSISVRSDGYVKAAQAAQAGASTASRTRTTSRPRAATTFNASQKVFVPRGVKEEEAPLELEVYNQGMYKTELCNKWQEVGECPYGDHCQFAHGIEELRPVIRHPRYKTEVCRMVLSGVVCPYGHRCHFRHALTENEKLMVPNKPRQRQFNLDR
ncbi:hypothetical protein DVH24_007472 [Malus domestica]|uniref:C3H1-type domain-containing protein n=2 Tax=Malus TaxID=3749 RepID=A0A498HFG6_MALDO|nr:hypothetical protein DVH24_007472 [Malus domestica]